MTTATKSIDLENAQPATEMPRGKAYIFAIGINQYEHCPPLFNAVNDALQMVELLTSKYQFERAEVTTLLDKNATRRNIFLHLEDLARRITPRDNLLIYFSGHGTYKDIIDEGFWVPVEAHLDDPGSFIPNSSIVKYLKAIKAHHIVIVSDACFSGAMFTEKFVGIHERQENIPSRWLMTSGRNEVVSDGKPGQHSPFADSLLLHLKSNREEVLPITKLSSSILEDVGGNSAQLPRCEPLRDVGHRGGEFMFRFKGSEGVIPPPPPPSPPTPGPSSNYWIKPEVRIGVALTLVLVTALILAGLFTDIFSGGGEVDKTPVTTTILSNKTTLSLGAIAPGETGSAEFTVQNNGNTTAQLDSVGYRCSGLSIEKNTPDSITTHQIKKFTVRWKAGDVPGRQQCVLSVGGKNVTNTIQIVVEVEVVKPQQPVKESDAVIPVTATSAKIVATKPTIDLGEIPVGKSRSFQYTLQNQGNSASPGLSAEKDCGEGAQLFQLEGIGAKSKKTYTDTWQAGDETGIHRCTLKIAGQPARIVITANVVSSTPPSGLTCVVRCNTGGVAGIAIRFYDSAGNEYSKISDNQSTVSFKVPCSMIGKRVEVNFDKNSAHDYRKVEFLSDRAFEVPNAIKGQ